MEATFQFLCSRPGRALATSATLVSLLALAGGCAAVAVGPRVHALRISDVVDEGDATRRASQRLLVAGLSADAAGDDAAAKGKYERALQLDATNPYVYLVFARFELERGNRERASSFLERARSLFDGEGSRSPGVEPHLLGMRGIIDGEHSSAIDDARRMSPDVWGDGALSAGELQ